MINALLIHTEPGSRKPGLDFRQCVSSAKLRVIPVIVDDGICLCVQLRVPEAFEEKVVQQALHVIGTGVNAQDLYSRDSHFGLELRQH
ncbi:MAG: hypothetical protein LH632_12525, partial [Rhodoferax sp.]|nr:hypothetical protein [Rhodoferax sp.]